MKAKNKTKNLHIGEPDLLDTNVVSFTRILDKILFVTLYIT